MQHKGKLVDDVLRESVREHLNHTTINNKGDIEGLLKPLGFDLSGNRKELVAIQEMIQRRHQIVHRADKLKPPDSQTPVLQPITSRDASRWLQATYQFMLSLNEPLLSKLARLEMETFKK